MCCWISIACVFWPCPEVVQTIMIIRPRYSHTLYSLGGSLLCPSPSFLYYSILSPTLSLSRQIIKQINRQDFKIQSKWNENVLQFHCNFPASIVGFVHMNFFVTSSFQRNLPLGIFYELVLYPLPASRLLQNLISTLAGMLPFLLPIQFCS